VKAKMWTISVILAIVFSICSCEYSKIVDVSTSREVVTNDKEVLVATYQYTAAGELSAKTENEYDLNGNWVEMRFYGADEELFSIIKFEYDSNGYQTKVIHHEENGELFSYTEIENDSNGKQIKALHYDAQGKLGGFEEDEYNSEAKLTKASFYHTVADVELAILIDYEYGSNGNMMKQTGYDQQGALIHTWIWEYDTEGRPTRLTYNGTTPELTSYYIDYEYNSEGNNFKANQYDENGELTSYTIYVYKTI
jgi:hypothetical protein